MFEEVGRMSRRRSANPTKAISITLPLSLLEQIDDQLTRTQSRSAWIASAARSKLSENDLSVSDADSKQLLAILVNRGVMSMEAFNVYSGKFKV